MSEKETTRTEISELGEFGLIDALTKNIIIKNKSTVKGVGDDTAVIEKNDEKYTLITTDLLIEGVHFDMIYTPLKHLGYKAAIVNFSDIVAMNGNPQQLIIGLSASNRFSVEALEEIYSGVYLACEKYGVDLVGGDTTSSPSSLFLSLTAIGEIKKEKIAYRSTAKSGDLICVSGDLGGAYMGLLILEREKKVFQDNPEIQPDLDGNDYLIGRQLKPEARLDIINKLEKEKIIPTSMIDISDGLASEVLHICKNSNLGCALYEEKLPIDATTAGAANEFGLDPTTAAMNGGEDYELLFTISQSDYEKIKNIKDISIIGHIAEKSEGSNLISTSGHIVEIKAQGWDALKK